MNAPRTLIALAAAAAALTLPAAAQAAPANDDFANAQVLQAGTTVSGSNVGATIETGERLWGYYLSSSVWYAWTAPKDGQVKFDACDKDFDAILTMWTGPDAGHTSYIDTGNGACGVTHAYTNWMNVVGGTTYLLQVTGHTSGKTQGTFRLTTSFDGSKDTHPPTVVVTSGPGAGQVATTNKPTWTFASNESDTTYECWIDSGTPFSCPAYFTAPDAISDGDHVLHMRGTDLAGNPSAVVDRAFSVDTTAPQSSILSGPDGDTTDATPTFTFGSPDDFATYTCAVDGDTPEACHGSWTAPTLSPGPHTFTVRAKDSRGNEESTGSVRHFTVLAPAGSGGSKPAPSSQTKPAAPGPQTGSAAPAAPSTARPARPTLRMVKRSRTGRTFTVTLRCAGPAGSRCTGSVKLLGRKGRKRTITVKAVSVPAGRSATVRLKAPRAATRIGVRLG